MCDEYIEGHLPRGNRQHCVRNVTPLLSPPLAKRLLLYSKACHRDGQGEREEKRGYVGREAIETKISRNSSQIMM